MIFIVLKKSKINTRLEIKILISKILREYLDFWRENSNIMTVTLTDDIVFGSLKIGPDAKIFSGFFYAVSFVGFFF